MEKFNRFIADKFSFNDYRYVSSEFAKENESEEFQTSLANDWENTSLSGNEKERLDRVLQKLHQKINPTVKVPFKIKMMKFAAVLLIPALLAIGVLSYLLLNNPKENAAWAQIYSPLGTRTEFQLPDGSTGWLNGGSSLKYPVNFSDRRVEVSGEAMFDVVHRNNAQFLVQTPYFDVKVLGTKFDVIAYENETTAEVILERGKVEVMGKEGKMGTELKPDEHFIFNKTKKQAMVKTIDSESYISWTQGILIFKNETMAEMVQRLERKYNADIVLKGDSLRSLVFRASFRDESLEEICKMISEVAPVDYKINKREKLSDDSYTKRQVEMWMR